MFSLFKVCSFKLKFRINFITFRLRPIEDQIHNITGHWNFIILYRLTAGP